MVIDTSALVAILLDEPERRRFTRCIEGAADRVVSAATLVETSIVLESRVGSAGVLALDRLLEVAAVRTIAVDAEQARLARSAYRRFGKGQHRAGLNFGDCFAYALAVSRGDPLLCKGDDFAATDLALALPPG